MFQLESLTKCRVNDVRVLAAKNRKPNDPPGGQILLSASLPCAQLAMFDGFLPGMLFRRADGKGKPQGELDGMEGMELTTIGDHVKRMGWQYEQTGCTLEIDYGAGGHGSNIRLVDCKVHRVSFAPRDGGSVVVQWTVDAPGLEAQAWAKLPGLKATDVQLTMRGPALDDSQADLEDDDPPAPKRGRGRPPKTPDAAAGAAQQQGDGGPWPFGANGDKNAPNTAIGTPPAGGEGGGDGGASDSEGGDPDVRAAQPAGRRGRGRAALAAVE
ncbi:hypothetical protein [Piscinibacter sakaiensis]|uniref:Uncharacterized protein n=1 Tax=Piscinibacter sakaiensis TaxID=1547922 RepID=A0A0K8P423_PISS1|nr:hypothetical protein [Piscinibacter sakaiensis]GAP37341.1 hypothetical protein ISF6_3196 [Piscinibacter sakaiensis]